MTKQKQKPKPAKSIQVKTTIQKDYTAYWLIAGFILILIVYFLSLSNGFTNWDDNQYVDNPYIKDLSLSGIVKIFSVYFWGNYHPLTLLSLGIDRLLGGGGPFMFHFTNLILHLSNSYLVFLLVKRLTKNNLLAVLTFIMFGLHPLHVESVAWVSERKDVLYSFFFLLSLILYTKYASCRKSIYYGFSLLFFLLSLLSKGQAVVLAAILPFIDYVVGRKWFSVKVLSEKIPFFILLLIFGWVAFRAQESSNALYFVHYSLPERFAFASFGLTQYLSKSILPIGLSAFYPYPLRLLNGSIPSYYWLFIVLLPGYLIGTYFLFKRSKFYAFGLGLFFLSIFPVLQIIPVGATIMADRYFYIPSVGLLLCIAVGLIEIRNITIRYVLFILFVFMFSCLSFSRCGIWKDSITLWDDVIKKYDYSIYAFYNRGTAYGDLGQWEKAIPDLSKAIEIDPNKTTAYYQRGVAYGKLGQWDKAIADYLKQTEISPNDIRVYVNCGAAYANLGQWGKAIVEYSRAIKIDSKNLGTYCNRGIAYGNLGLWEKAIADYSTVIDINPKYPDVYINRGNAYGNIGQWKEAIADYSRVIEIDPSNSIAYYDRGVGYTNIKQWDKAFADFSKATKIDPNFAKAVSNREIVYKMLNGEKK